MLYYIFFFQRILEFGIHTVRVKIQGLGPGRMVIL